MHLKNLFQLLSFILIYLAIPILIFAYDVPYLLSSNVSEMQNNVFKVSKYILLLILILELLFIYKIYGKNLNGYIDFSLRLLDRVERVIYRDIPLVTIIVMILCLYQLSHFFLRYRESPPVIIPYSEILKSDLLHYKRFESNIYEGITWYFTRAPASIANSHPIIGDGDGAKKFREVKLTSEYYLCDNSSIAFINSGGFRNEEPYHGFAIEFSGKNCTYIANFLEKRGYKTIIETPRYSINQFPQE